MRDKKILNTTGKSQRRELRKKTRKRSIKGVKKILKKMVRRYSASKRGEGRNLPASRGRLKKTEEGGREKKRGGDNKEQWQGRERVETWAKTFSKNQELSGVQGIIKKTN